MIMSEETALRQDIRPLRIALLNLMPDKIKTETQFARLIGATPLQIELTLVRMSDHVPKNTSMEHLEAFYRPWSEVCREKFDGLIITGAPVETMEFEQVGYWHELCKIFKWSQSHVHATFAVCWGAQAMLHHFHQVPKYLLPQKAFGCYLHRNLMPSSPYLRGFSDDFFIPISRWSEIKKQDIPVGLELLMESDEKGPCLIHDPCHRALYMFNHIEYDTHTLADEYHRDMGNGQVVPLPVHYFPHNDPSMSPKNRWRGHAHLLFGNWINQIYQTCPYDINLIGI